RIVAPYDGRRERRLVQRREMTGAVTARRGVFDKGEREAGVRRVPDDRFVKTDNVDGALRDGFSARDLPGVCIHGEVELRVARGTREGLGRVRRAGPVLVEGHR